MASKQRVQKKMTKTEKKFQTDNIRGHIKSQNTLKWVDYDTAKESLSEYCYTINNFFSQSRVDSSFEKRSFIVAHMWFFFMNKDIVYLIVKNRLKDL